MFINKLSPTGTAGIVLANGSMTSNTSGEGEIRRKIIEDGLVDCMVALPTQLFFNTQIPACLWFLARNRSNHKFRNRTKDILFIDARNLGEMVNRRNKILGETDIHKISNTYHSWRNPEGDYKDIPGFCKSASVDDVAKNDFVLTPGRYVGTENVEDDGVKYDYKIAEISENLREYFTQSIDLQERIKVNLSKVGIEI